MRWSERRAVHAALARDLLNCEWDQFVNYRIAKEQAALYGPGTVYRKVRDYAQAA